VVELATVDAIGDEGQAVAAQREHQRNAGEVGGGERDARQIADRAEKERTQQGEGEGRGPAVEGVGHGGAVAGIGLVEEAIGGNDREGAVEHAAECSEQEVERPGELADGGVKHQQVVGEGTAEHDGRGGCALDRGDQERERRATDDRGGEIAADEVAGKEVGLDGGHQRVTSPTGSTSCGPAWRYRVALRLDWMSDQTCQTCASVRPAARATSAAGTSWLSP